MDPTTLAYTYCVVAFTLVVSNVLMFYHRKEKAYLVFALSFFVSTLGTFLLTILGANEPILGIITSNALSLVTFPLILMAFKLHFHDELQWPLHYSLMIAGLIASFAIFTYVYPSFLIRSIVYTVLLVVFLSDIFFYLLARLELHSPIIRVGFFSIIAMYLAAHLVRLTLVIVDVVVHQINFHEADSVTLMVLSGIVYSILWLTMIQLLGSETILVKLSAKDSEITQLVRTDLLTGLWNRSYFEEQLPMIVEQAAEQSDQLCLIYVDLDNFKDINEHFGHQIGDQVIKEVVGIIRQTLSPSTVVTRWGGQEFVILSKSGGDDSMRKAEVLRHNIANNNFAHFETVTASFGVAAFHSDEALDLWLKRAENALKDSKSEGRNKVSYLK